MSRRPVTAPSAGRAAGGLLAVLVAETWPIGPERPYGPGGPITRAMVHLARSYTAAPAPLGELGARHDGVPAPAWLLPAAIARPDPIERATDALELATRSGVGLHQLRACLTYVDLAARIFAGQDAPDAIWELTGRGPQAAQPLETARDAIDGLRLGLWALAQPAGFGELLPRLAVTASPPAAAAAGGLVGVRDGFDSIPPGLYRRLDPHRDCLALAAPLTRPGRALVEAAGPSEAR